MPFTQDPIQRVTPRILIVAGSDSGGGAGIQADIKTVTMLGGHAMTAITAVTAQNTLGVQAVHPIPTDIVVAQMRSCLDDIGVDAIKIGMIGSAETAHAVADVLEELCAEPAPLPAREGLGVGAERSEAPTSAEERDPAGRAPTPGPSLPGRGVPIVFDPVMVATSGATLADADTITAFDRLMRLATLVTPNIPELAALGGDSAVLARASALLAKGGHAEGDLLVDRLLTRDGEQARWASERIVTSSTHGTGCTLASAIATNLARGLSVQAAVVRARQFVRLALRDAPGLGRGHGPLGQQKVRLDLGDGPRLNQITLPADELALSPDFYRLLGLRQIVGEDDAFFYARFETVGGGTLSVHKGAAPTVYFEYEDLDGEVARLQSAGVTFDQLPTEQPWLWREARLTDPAGNTVCLYQADENRRYPPWRRTDA